MFNNTEVQNKIKDIVASVSGALATPVAFASKTVVDNVETVVGAADSGNLNLPISDAVKQQLTGVADRMNTTIPSTSADVSNLLSSVGSQLSQMTSAANAIMSSISGDITSNISMANSAISTVTSPIGVGSQVLSSTIAAATGLVKQATNLISKTASNAIQRTINAVTAVLNKPVLNTSLIESAIPAFNLNSIVSDALTTLPSSMLNTSANIVTGNLANTEANSSIINSAITKLLGEFPSVPDIPLADIVTTMYSYNTDSSGNIIPYPTYTNMDTTNLSSTLNTAGDITNRQLGNVSNILRDLCDGKRLSSWLSYQALKDRYDALIAALGGLGLADALRDLLSCDNLFDERSTRTMVNYSKPISINKGDPYMYETILDTVGRDSMTATPDRDLFWLNSNMTLNPAVDNVPAKKAAYASVYDKLMNAPVSTAVAGIPGTSQYAAIDSVKTVNMAKNNTDIITDAIGSDTVKIAAAAITAWA